MTKVVKKDNENEGAQIRGKHTMTIEGHKELEQILKNTKKI